VDYEFIVTCNSVREDVRQSVFEVAGRFDAQVLFTVDEGAKDCYYAAEIAAKRARGDWLCFPSEDSYYVPYFADRMSVWTAEWDFIYCDMLYTSKWTEPVAWTYSVMDVRPVRQHIDKTCFMLRRELFEVFPGKRDGAPCEADGELAEELVSRGVRHGKAHGGALVVHN
jgi:hypothetical protein